MRYGAANATAQKAPPAAHLDRSTDRGPTTITIASITAATRPTWGLASTPTPTTTPAARIDVPLRRTTVRIASHPRPVVLSMSKVVVVTKWPTASAKPEQAVQDAAMICARVPPPTSRAITAARIVVAAAASADGVRSRRSDPGASAFIAQARNGANGG